MDITQLGSSGLKVSSLCLGTMQFGWRIDEEQSHKVMDRALELGIFFFDTADIYSRWADNSYPGKTEEIIGRWFKEADRDEIVLATKVRGQIGDRPNDVGLGRKHIEDAVQGSLTRLGTEWIDLYQVHSFDPDVKIAETLRALDDIVKRGSAHYLGASNFPGWRLAEALGVSKAEGLADFVSLQPKYNIVNRMKFELGNQQLCTQYGLGVMPYSPQAAGFLTGKYKKDQPLPDSPRANSIKERYMNDRAWNILDKVIELAGNHDATPAQVSLAWLLMQPSVSCPIVGANSVGQLEEAAGATSIKLSNDDLDQLNTVSAWKSVMDVH